MVGRPKEFDVDEALDRAMRVFWEKGYYQTSIQDLVDAMAINRASMYDTFGDKHELFLRVLDFYIDRMKQISKQALEEPTSALSAIKTYFKRRYGTSGQRRPGAGCLITNSVVEMATYDKEVRKCVERYWKFSEDAFCALIEKAQDQGEIATDRSARALARYLLNFSIGLSVTRRAGFSPAFNADVLDLGLSFFEPERQGAGSRTPAARKRTADF